MTRFTHEMTETLRQMYAAGCKCSEIAEDLGVEEIQVRSRASRIGITNRIAPLLQKAAEIRALQIGDSIDGLSKSQADKWSARLKHQGMTVKRFVKNGALGLKRIA